VVETHAIGGLFAKIEKDLLNKSTAVQRFCPLARKTLALYPEKRLVTLNGLDFGGIGMIPTMQLRVNLFVVALFAEFFKNAAIF
jgi:hypothetical protein